MLESLSITNHSKSCISIHVPRTIRILTFSTKTHSSDCSPPISRQKITLSNPSLGSTVQLGGSTSHSSRAPVGDIVGWTVVGTMVGARVVGAMVGDTVGDMVGDEVG